MKNRMYLQLFEDGAGAGSGVQGGSTGTGNGSQGGNAGGASGAHGTGTYTYEQLEEIANARVERSERTALANFFRNQGMTETEVTQAIAAFKAQKAANQPNVSQLQSDLEAANRENERLKNEKLLTQKGVKADDLDYVAFKVSKMVDEKTDFAKATDKFLKENPRFVGSASGGTYRISTGAQAGGSQGAGNPNNDINAAIRRAAGR